jgi:hypothetical protein
MAKSSQRKSFLATTSAEEYLPSNGGTEAKAAFDDIKNALCSSPVLAHFYPHNDLHCFFDASKE